MSLDLSALRAQLQSENIDILRLVYADVLGIPHMARLFAKVFGLPIPVVEF
jgi:hypothetical protein